MRSFLLLWLAGVYACSLSTANDIKEKSSSTQDLSRKVIVELFTSQGCSSCPPADKLVRSLAKLDTNLIVLSFHVDYWDRSGWKDVFSNHQYTVRQHQYAQALQANSVYTPQAVVQGQYQMVGSNQPGISAAITKVRSEKANLSLNATATVSKNAVSVNYELSDVANNCQVAVAIVQTNTSTAIARGENAGVQLSGYNVVRSLQTAPLTKKTSSFEIAIPSGLEAGNTSVIVFVQDTKSKKVITATQVKL